MDTTSIAWRAGLAFGTGSLLIRVIEDGMDSKHWQMGMHQIQQGDAGYSVFWGAKILDDDSSLILLASNPSPIGDEWSEEAWTMTIIHNGESLDNREFPDQHTMTEWMQWAKKNWQSLLMEIVL